MSIFGRVVNKIPNSLKNKAKGSDKPTKNLSEADFSKNFRKQVNVTPEAAPGTTVLGMDFVEDSSMPEMVEQAPQKTSKPKVKPQPMTKPKPKVKSQDKPKVKAQTKPKAKVEEKPKKKTTSDKVEKPDTKITKTKEKKSTKKSKELSLVRKSNGEIIKIQKDNFVIGKSKYCDCQIIGNNTISRKHIIAHLSDDGILSIEDNKSKNGTFIDGSKVEPGKQYELSKGQSVRLSDEVFHVKEV